jgi:hypothetical protein
MPELDHIDLIAGDVTGYVEPTDEECPDMDTRDLATYVEEGNYVPAYCRETNESTEVVKTFKRQGECKKNDGYMTFTYEFEADKDRYFRLRGTNMPAGIPFETDAQGNPLADSEAEENLYNMDGDDLSVYLFNDITCYVLDSKLENATTGKLDEVLEAYADLWVYSNPIYIDVIDGKQKGHKKDKHEKKDK